MASRRKQKAEGTGSSRKGISAEVFGSFNKKGEFQAKVIAKSEKSIFLIRTLLLKSVMFQGLSDKNLRVVIGAMDERRMEAEELVIREGADGDVLYVVGEGEYECSKVVTGTRTYLKTYKEGELFG